MPKFDPLSKELLLIPEMMQRLPDEKADEFLRIRMSTLEENNRIATNRLSIAVSMIVVSIGFVISATAITLQIIPKDSRAQGGIAIFGIVAIVVLLIFAGLLMREFEESRKNWLVLRDRYEQELFNLWLKKGERQ
jgi:hypothetical protein